MIASIQGKVAQSGLQHIVVTVQGLGYLVFVPDPLSYYEGDDVHLHTHLVVREDSLTLYGFPSANEREIFEVLLKVNGVGPRMALAILATMTIDSLRGAVQSERAELLTRVPGIGKKTAQKIVFELKDKLAGGLDSGPAYEISDVNSEVIDALVALGYSIVEAQTALQSLSRDAPNSVEDRVRLALQFFA
jgi:Holliday junction DNA helicase RuvA